MRSLVVEVDDRAEPSVGTPRCRNPRPRFLPCLSGAKAYTGEVDDSIDDTHLHHGLKRHPSTQIQKVQVCSFFLFHLSNLNV